MQNYEVKKTWVSIAEKETLIELVRRCENKSFVKFIKEHPIECFPMEYFEKFGWIKLRFYDLQNDFENGKDPLSNNNTYQEYYIEEEDCLDLSDWDLSRGCLIGTKHTSQPIMKNQEPKSTFNNQRVTASKILEIKQTTKDLVLLVSSYEEVPLAMKCILWSLNNEPQTTAKLYSYIYLIENGSKRKFTKDDYQFLNLIIDKASTPNDGRLKLEKIKKDGKEVWLYSNPSKKRIGWFYDGKLWSRAELSKETGINENTLYSRLAKNDIYSVMTEGIITK